MFKNLLKSLLGDESGKEATFETTQQDTNQHHIENEVKDEEIEDEVYNETHDVVFDPVTLHGTHYSVAQFDAEVKKRAEKWIASEKESGENLDQKDIENIYFNYNREVYKEFNYLNGSQEGSDQMLRWEMATRNNKLGIRAEDGSKKEDENDPLFDPIHGLNLKDYVSMSMKLGQGFSVEQVCKAMGVEPAIWDELNTLWTKRMQEDSSFKIATLFGEYYQDTSDHPKLSSLQLQMSDAGSANLEKLKTDPYFYYELAGARQAAYEYGMDGAQWIQDNYDVNLTDFQSVAMIHSTNLNNEMDTAKITHFHDFEQEQQKLYATKFAEEQGGNVADDVEF